MNVPLPLIDVRLAAAMSGNGHRHNTFPYNKQQNFPQGYGQRNQRSSSTSHYYNNDGIIRDTYDLERYIRNGNRQLPTWDMDVLHKAFKEIPWQGSNQFTYFINAVKALATEQNHSELQKKFKGKEVLLNRHEVAIILANAFLCRLHFTDHETSLNFNGLYSSRGPQENKKEKLKCLINYIFFVASRPPNVQEHVHYRRVNLSKNAEGALLSKLTGRGTILSDVRIIPNLSLSDAQGMAQVDFANRKVGGGVLSNGCLQEEIKFITCPELLLAKLFPNEMRDNEAIVVNYALQYINSSGYASSFKFQSLREVPLEFGGPLIAIDATDYSKVFHQYEQFLPNHVLRELKKAYVGFNAVDSQAIATGNWGGGAFKGDPVLKFKIQWIAATLAGKKLFYYPYRNGALMNKIEDVQTEFRGRSMNDLRDSIISARDIHEMIESRVPKRKPMATAHPADSSTTASGHVDAKRNKQCQTSSTPVWIHWSYLSLSHNPNDQAQDLAPMEFSFLQCLKNTLLYPFKKVASFMVWTREETNANQIYTMRGACQELNQINPLLSSGSSSHVVGESDLPRVEANVGFLRGTLKRVHRYVRRMRQRR